MKKILILLLLASSFKTQLNGVWCIPNEDYLYSIDQETDHLLDVYWNQNECSDWRRYKAAENDAQVSEICNKTLRRPGCLYKNRHGQAFDNLSPLLTWDDWKHHKPYVVLSNVPKDKKETVMLCSNACEGRGGIYGGDFSQIRTLKEVKEEHNYRKILVDAILCHCKPKKK